MAQPPNYDETTAHVAGNIASAIVEGMIIRGFSAITDEQKGRIAAESVAMAQRILELCRDEVGERNADD